MTKAVTFTQAQVRPMVYFVQIGKHIKIGFTTNIERRIKEFLTSSLDAELLLVIPGSRDLERLLHLKLSDCRVQRELFRRDHRILSFIRHFEYGGLERGLEYLDSSSPVAVAQRKAEDHVKRVATVRKSRAEKDAYFASLVAERKNRLGW